MKKSFVVAWLLSLSVFSPIAATAQTHYTSKVEIGVKGGIEMPRMFFNPSVKQKLPIGATAGIQFRYTEQKNFALIAEVNFAQKGWENLYEETDYRYRRTVNYIEVPVLAHIYFGGKKRLFFNVGPQVGFVLGESTSCNFNVYDISSLPDFPNKNKTNAELTTPVENKVDFGISAGLGGEFAFNPRNAINLEARFYYGIGNMFHANRQGPIRSSNAMAISVTLGYWFRLK